MGYSKEDILKKIHNDMKSITCISKIFKVRIKKFLENNLNNITIRSGKFLMDKIFYNKFILQLAIPNNVTNDIFYYKNFNRLIYYDLIHSASSKFPRGKAQVSINPHHKCLLSSDFNLIDMWAEKRRYVLNALDNNEIRYLYVYLRFFQLNQLSKETMSTIKFKDLIDIPEIESLILYTEVDTFFSKASIYRLVKLDTYASSMLKRILRHKNDDDVKIFQNIDGYESFADEFRKNFLNKMRIQSIKNINKIFHIFNSSPMEVTLDSNIIHSVELTISEIDILFPNKVPLHMLKIEKQRIEETFYSIEKEKKKDKKESKCGSHTDLFDTEILKSFFSVQEKPSLGKIDEAIEELNRYIDIHNTKHSDLIYEYIIHLLKKLKSKKTDKIKLSTFKSYIWTLNKFIFRRIENLDTIRESEVSNILIQIHDLKFNSQKTVVSIIRSFFTHHELVNNFKVDLNRVHYPKSMIFDFEIEKILDEVEQEYMQAMGFPIKKRIHNFCIFQRQVIVLLAYYGGLRKNELRSRLFKDFVFDKDIFSKDAEHSFSKYKFTIDINSKGFSSISGKSLKTSSAKRRIDFVIPSKRHFEIIKNFLLIRKEERKDTFLFLSLTKDRRISTMVIEENIFIEFNEIIKDITKRYCTFHSLRHAFATNKMMNIMEKEKTPYGFFELNIQCGHSLPEATLNSYVHWQLMMILWSYSKRDLVPEI